MTKPTPKENFENKYEVNTINGCWEWTAATAPFGYGYFGFRGKVWKAHRVAYTLYLGEIPPGLLICHSCDNPKCVNPSHLFSGTNLDNALDKMRKGRGGHLKGDKHARCKYTKEQVEFIRNSPLPTKEIKEIIPGISSGHVWRIRKHILRPEG